MAGFDPALGSNAPAVLLDNAKRLDELVNSDALTVPDRAGVDLDTWRGMMAKTMKFVRTSFHSVGSI